MKIIVDLIEKEKLVFSIAGYAKIKLFGKLNPNRMELGGGGGG